MFVFIFKMIINQEAKAQLVFTTQQRMPSFLSARPKGT